MQQRMDQPRQQGCEQHPGDGHPGGLTNKLPIGKRRAGRDIHGFK
jgi:hypothetical protein